ncbi:zinc-finger domain-containing protein [Lichenihabitans sp. Uapishka_5]|uniref:zinc-finger domain-containing protein n=1 Tax=Lichenihabitans sp. Uapishka_5 TaxID=3037302 RepID=UPI0029E7D280|nr:zinc-finger domain-containing protein [Lichenihabitans sp. Uapishka_5]MDX7949659.1 zinc-finger domain-containing protein [Lichenihabitans sp. Uapishka_5]
MAAPHQTPHFHNEIGVPTIRVGVREFMCTGALPPFDHPHTFIDMGDSGDAVCPYCSTHYVHDGSLGHGCEPASCAYRPDTAP